MIPLPSGTKIWLVAGITDMRNGFNGLVSTTDEKWLFRNLGGDFHASGLMTLCLSSSNPARPYIWRFNIFRRFT